MNRVSAIVLAGFTAFLAVCLFSYSPADPPDSLVFPFAKGYENRCGQWGAYVASMLLNGLGYSVYLLFLPLFASISYLWCGKPVTQIFMRQVGLVLIIVAASGLFCLYETGTWNGPMIGPGGYLGVTCVYFLNSYFSPVGLTIIFVSTLIGGLVLTCDYLLIRIFLWMFGLRPFHLPDDGVSAQIPQGKPNRSIQTLSSLDNRNTEIDEPINDAGDFEPEVDETEKMEDEEEYECAEDEAEQELNNDESVEKTEKKTVKLKKGLIRWLKSRHTEDERLENREVRSETEADDTFETEYALPSVELLIESEAHDYTQQLQAAKRQSKQLEEAFADYGLNIKVVGIQCGPVIAQHEIELERGLRLNKITNLTDDLSRALGVPTVRIVAPIPGKNTVGVEVPIKTRQLVLLREVIEEAPEKVISKMSIPVFLGKDVAGSPMIFDLTKMPHLLIAGSTGTGKSVCLNSIIMSILMTRTPEECRMIMIDPKWVELSLYESIPHLMHPVVTDMKKAEAILAWAVDKMEQRLQILSRAKVRQLSEFNDLTEEELFRRIKPESDEEWDETPRSMPYMVIVADEMADLMWTAAKEVETHISRLAAKSRAAGIHLVLATQKPTVDVITGLIKSNLPARIAFMVASNTDSRVILDCSGAEKLLGDGDMLFLKPGTSQVVRGQGTYVSTPEINEIIADIATDTPDFVTELVELPTGDETIDGGPADPRDELFNQAVENVIRESQGRGKGKCSISRLQLKMKIGYPRAARLFDYMEEDGIVGPGDGQKPREVLISLQQWRSRLAEEEGQVARDERLGIRDKVKGKRDKGKGSHHSPLVPRPSSLEQGIGPVKDVDDSMLTEIRPNTKQRDRIQEERKGKRDKGKEISSSLSPIPYPMVPLEKPLAPRSSDNIYDVVPVADGDVPFDADDGQWEYEYVYEYEEFEVDADARDNWESEEEWDETEPSQHEYEEEYDEQDYDEEYDFR